MIVGEDWRVAYGHGRTVGSVRGDVMNGWQGSLAERLFASPIDFVCECAQVDCVEQILLTVSEYEALRREPERFAVSSGHDNPDVDRVVAGGERYVVVEKIGTGAATARRLDPRGSVSEK